MGNVVRDMCVMRLNDDASVIVSPFYSHPDWASICLANALSYIQRLHERRANPGIVNHSWQDLRTQPSSLTPLASAILSHREQAVTALLEASADPSTPGALPADGLIADVLSPVMISATSSNMACHLLMLNSGPRCRAATMSNAGASMANTAITGAPAADYRTWTAVLPICKTWVSASHSWQAANHMTVQCCVLAAWASGLQSQPS